MFINTKKWHIFGTKSSNNMKLDGKKVIMEKISCYNGFFKKGITYTKLVEYHFDTEELATEFYYTVSGDQDLYDKCMGKQNK